MRIRREDAPVMFSEDVVLGAIRGSVILCFALLSVFPTAAQSQIGCAAETEEYVNRNQVDYGPLKVSVVQGIVSDPGEPIPKACVLLFENGTHKLVSKIETASDGSFKFSGIKDGNYRLIVKADGLCAANVPIFVRHRRKEKKRLMVHMKPAGIDSCSYGDLE